MKLLLCMKCEDVFKLSKDKEKYCDCGNVSGKYLEDGLHAEVSIKEKGTGYILGVGNSSLLNAIQRYSLREDRKDWGNEFNAWIIPEWSPRVEFK